MAEEFRPVEASPKKKMSPWIIVAIILLVLLCCCIMLLVVLVFVPALLGPSIGTVFSNIIEEIATPIP